MKIFLKVREEYEQALMRDEEVVAGIPAYVAFLLSSSFSPFSSLLPPLLPRRVVVSWIEIYIRYGANEIDIMRNGIGNPTLLS